MLFDRPRRLTTVVLHRLLVLTIALVHAQAADLQDPHAVGMTRGIECDADLGWLSLLSKRAGLHRGSPNITASMTYPSIKNISSLNVSAIPRTDEQFILPTEHEEVGQLSPWQQTAQLDDVAATDADMLVVKKPQLHQFTYQKQVSQDEQAFLMSEIMQGTWACFIIVVLLIVFVYEKSAYATGLDLPKRVEGFNGVLFVVQILIFCQISLRQPFQVSSVFLMLIGAMLPFQQRDSRSASTVFETFKFSLGQLMRILPLYWIVASIVLARNAYEPGGLFNPFMQLVHMPYHHYQIFWAFNSWTAAPSSYWFVSTIASFYFMWPIINCALQRLGTRRNMTSCIVVAVLCYIVKFLYAAAVLMEPQAAKSAVGHEVAYTREVGGYTVSFLMNPLVRAPDFLIGVMAAHMLEVMASQEQANRAVNRTLRQMLGVLADASMILILLLIIAIGAFNLIPADGSAAGSLMSIAFMMNLESPLWLAVLLGVGCGDAHSRPYCYLRRIMALRPVQAMGVASYAFYLWSVFLLQTYGCFYQREGDTCANGDLAVIYAYSMCLAVVSYRCIQEPFFNSFRGIVDTKQEEGIDLFDASRIPNNPLPVSALFSNASPVAATPGQAPQPSASAGLAPASPLDASSAAAASSSGSSDLSSSSSSPAATLPRSESNSAFACGNYSYASTAAGSSSSGASSSSSTTRATSLASGAASRATSSSMDAY